PNRLLLELKRVTSPRCLPHLRYPFALEQLAKEYVLRGQGHSAGLDLHCTGYLCAMRFALRIDGRNFGVYIVTILYGLDLQQPTWM
ncbi:MAG: hypothetical protein ABSD59_21115, partial [Terracidiphilus sp.]